MISHLENKRGKTFQWRPGGWEADAWQHTSRSITLIILGVVFMSRLICMIFIADLIACRLDIMNTVACRPITLRLWSGFLVWLL